MSQRSMDVKLGADTSGFLTGINDVVAKLNVLNKQMLESQTATKKINQEMREYEKEQAKIQKEIKESGSATDEQKEKLAKLEQKLDGARSRAAELKTEQSKLKSEIKSASKELDEQTEGLNNAIKAEEEAKKTTTEVQSATEKLTSEISEQEKELKNLKKSYSDIALEQGKNSEEAKELGSKISDLSDVLEKNRAKLNDSTYSVDDFTDKSEEAEKAITEVQSATEKSSDGFTVMKGAISNLVSDALNVAVDKFKEMAVSSEQALNSLQVKTGMSTEAVSELKDEMYAIYKDNFGDSLTDVADKIALVAQNIDESDPSKIKSITENAIGLSDAFGSDFEENLRGVNGLMTNMGLTAEEAFDYIAKGSQNGLDKTHELTDNLAEYSQIWSQAGFSAEEMFSILQNGLDSGAYKLDNVNDLVKEISISIIDGRISENIGSFSKKTQQLFESFENGGATQREVFDSIIDDLSNTTNLAEQLATASTNWSALGEDNAMSVITALNNVNDTYKDVSGTMQEINDIQYEDVGSQVQALGRQFEVDILQPVVEKATPKIKEFISWVSDHLPEVTSALAGLTVGVVSFKAASVAGDFLKTIILGFKSLKPAIESATDAMKIHNATVKANFYVALASAILSAIAAITTWIVTANNATQATVNNTQSIKNYTQAMQEAVSSAEDSEAQATSEIALIKSKEERYDELRKKVNLTAQEKNELNNLGADLAKTIGTTTDKLKDESGAWKDASSSIEEYTKQLKSRLILESSEEALKEAYKITEFDITQEDVDTALKSYNEYADKLWEQIQNSSKYHDFAREGKKFDKSGALNNKELVEVVGGDWNKLRNLESVWSNLYFQRDQALGVIDKYTKIANDERKKINDEGEALEESTGSIKNKTKAVEDLSKTLSEMASKTTAVTNAEKEYKENGKLTVSTLQAIIDKYPDLENEVYKYMLNLEDAKTLIQSMKNTYQDDLKSYISVVTQKAEKSNTFYNELINANASFVNAAKEQYGIDLMNFKNLQEAKQAMIAVEKSKIDKGWGNSASWSDKFDLAGNLSKFNDAMNKYGDANTYLANQAVKRFINNSLSATTNYLNLFDKTTDKIKKTANEGKKATDKASKAEDTLLKKYELVEAAYNRLVDKRIERIQKEQEAKEKAKNAAIAAIDAEVEARKRLNEDKESQNELDTINARLKYEKLDELSRRELMRRKQELLNERAEIKWQRMMSDKKDKLQSSYDSYKNNSDSMIDALQRAANSAADYFDTLKNGYKTNSYIVNNNSDTRNIQIIQNALSNQQMVDKLLKAIYSK